MQKPYSAPQTGLEVGRVWLILYLHNFFLVVGLKLVLGHRLLFSFVGQVGQALDRGVVRDGRLEHVEHAGFTRQATRLKDNGWGWVTWATKHCASYHFFPLSWSWGEKTTETVSSALTGE